MSSNDIHYRFKLSVILNTIVILVKVFYGIEANSVALLADAAHNMCDVLGLFISWVGYILVFKRAPQNFTFGFKNATVIAAFLNSVLLFMIVGGILFGAYQNFQSPTKIDSMDVICAASVGVILSGFTAILFMKNKEGDINIKSVFLHMLFDAITSFAVILSGIITLYYPHFTWIDPLVSLLIAAVITVGSWKLFMNSLNLMMLAAPNSVDVEKIKNEIASLDGVASFHDLHIWSLSTTDVALAVHIVAKASYFKPETIKEMTDRIRGKYSIKHVTIQLESENYQMNCEDNFKNEPAGKYES